MQVQDEIIKLLEKNIVFYDNIGSGPIAQMPRADYDQALAKLKEEPEPIEFVKECREIRKRGASAGQWEYATKMMEACKIIVQLHAENKKLVEGQKAKTQGGGAGNAF